MKKFAVLVSGNGSNLQAILDAIAQQKLNAEISVVVSNVADAFALERAKSANTTAVFFPKRTGEKRSDYDDRLATLIASFEVDYVLLLGWMRILTKNFLQHFTAINLHPALPHTFAGVECIEKQFDSFQKGDCIIDAGHFDTEKFFTYAMKNFLTERLEIDVHTSNSLQNPFKFVEDYYE